MHNPARWLRIALAAAVAGSVAVTLAFLLPPGWASDGLRGTLFCAGLMGIVFGGGGAVQAGRTLAAERRLASGDDVIARWSIDAARWRRFAALESRLMQEGARLNELGSVDAPPANDVAIIVGKDAVNIGGSIHQVPRRGTPEITRAELVSDDPDYIALDLLYPGGGVDASHIPPRRAALRFPVAPSAWRDARMVVANFKGLLPQEADFFHGKGDGSDPEDLNTCIQCGYQVHRYMSECPQCGGGMLTRRWARRFGAIVAVAGAFICAVMGTVMYHTLPLLLRPGVTIDGSRFTGNGLTAAVVLAVFVVVLAFGLTALSYGAWQVATGKRDKRVMHFMAGIFSLLLGVAMLIQHLGH